MRGQESEGSGQHHIFTLNNYHSVQQEGTFMNPSSHNSGARESVEVFFFGVSKIPIWVGSIIHFWFTCMFRLIKTMGKKTNKQKSKGPWLRPWIFFLLIANILHPCFIICTVEVILCSWYTCISKQDSEANEIGKPWECLQLPTQICRLMGLLNTVCMCFMPVFLCHRSQYQTTWCGFELP